MPNEMQVHENEFEQIALLTQKLLKTKHYSSIGPEGVFAIVQKAIVMGISPLEALNGGMYYVHGKVELRAHLLNHLIRSKGHSFFRDPASNDEICILHGRRGDDGQMWTESFSIEDAKKAGLANKEVWKSYPRNMLFARALSNLARMLFPEIICGCYVEGEIPLGDVESRISLPEQDVIDMKYLTNSQVKVLEEAVADNPEMCDRISGMFGKDWSMIDPENYEKLIEELA